MLSDQHEIMVGRGHVEELDQLGCISVDICHSAYIYLLVSGFLQKFLVILRKNIRGLQYK